ncbi:MAG: DUF418 domain-containing protein [Paramuribaculum sp.]|nr:DUF418 domain-containing protein [Paramuribaculum sp.]
MSEGNIMMPVRPSERFVILDALRGFALLGICMANFPEFSLYSFLDESAKSEMSSSLWDDITQYLLYIFVDGKFYTIFSLLFGIGFSIIIANCMKRGNNGLKVFYRRMFYLLLIGFAHLILIWSGDILMLYALVGMLLPVFMKLSDRKILILAGVFLILPVIIDSLCEIFRWNPSAWLVGQQWKYCGIYGITEENFAYWLADSKSYNDVFKFLIQGAWERMSEFVDGNRYFKVLGLFLIGYYIGRNRLYANIGELKSSLKKIAVAGICLGLPLSAVYAWSAMEGHPLGGGIHSLFYFLSVYLTSFGYIAVFCLTYLAFKKLFVWKLFSAPGRMALTNYIGQSLIGIFIFYGIGLGFGAKMGLFEVEIIVACVFIFEIIFSSIWLKIFRFGPLEWIWRCLTYKQIFPLLK